MTKEAHLARLLRSGLIAVVRAATSHGLIDLAEALVAGGVEAIEITFTTPRAARVLEEAADRLGRRAILGAGTVLDAETARVALLSGAEFVVSPIVAPDVIALCRRYDKLVIPGALTPTEVVAAWQAGADLVKIFPADSVGPEYLRSLRGPLPQVKLVPTGGIDLTNAAKYVQAGACAVGVGSALVDPRAIVEGDWGRLEALARQFVETVAAARNGNA